MVLAIVVNALLMAFALGAAALAQPALAAIAGTAFVTVSKRLTRSLL